MNHTFKCENHVSLLDIELLESSFDGMPRTNAARKGAVAEQKEQARFDGELAELGE